jgi:hypothetical protein
MFHTNFYHGLSVPEIISSGSYILACAGKRYGLQIAIVHQFRGGMQGANYGYQYLRRIEYQYVFSIFVFIVHGVKQELLSFARLALSFPD